MRHCERARFHVRLAVAVLGACALACLVRATSAAERPEGPPPWRVGGRVGFTVDAAAFPQSASDSGRVSSGGSGHELEVYVRVPPSTIDQLTRDANGDARLRATVRVRGRYGSQALESSQEFALTPLDTTRGQGKVVLMRFPASPGACRIDVRLDDVLSRKKGLVYAGRNANESAEVRGSVELPRPQAGRDLSDIEFAWPVHTREPGLAFVRSNRARVPNPDRLYGLFAPQLEAAFSARSKPGDARGWRWVARILDANGTLVAQRESTAVGAVTLDGEVTFDVSNEPAGAYDLEIKAWQEGDPGALLRRSRFSIGWETDTWLRNAADVADDVHFLLQSEDEDAFTIMPPGEQERFLKDFWRKRDPTPETALNEAHAVFDERVAYVNRTYSQHAIAKGMFSDMGRVYIRYGEPAEVLHQVMPAGEETLTKQLEEIMISEDRAVGSINQKGPGGDQRPYEVWLYEGEIPLPPDADPLADRRSVRRRRLLFLFVDEQGMGTYTLRYSTE